MLLENTLLAATTRLSRAATRTLLI